MAIYCVTDRPDSKVVKFGYSADATRRIQELNEFRRTCCSDTHDLIVLAVHHTATRKDEGALHAKLNWYRVKSEWYRVKQGGVVERCISLLREQRLPSSSWLEKSFDNNQKRSWSRQCLKEAIMDSQLAGVENYD